MTKKELLKEASTLSVEELQEIIKSKNLNKEFIPHKDLHEKFFLVYWNGSIRSSIKESIDDFEKKLRSILKKTPYGVNTYIGYDKFIQTLDYGHSVDDIIAFIRNILAEISENASYGALRQIELFNKKKECIWFIYYNNDVIKNLNNTAELVKGPNPKIFEYMCNLEHLRQHQLISEADIKMIKETLNFVTDHFYFKDDNKLNAYDSLEDSKDRDEHFKWVRNKMLELKFCSQDQVKINPLMNVLLRRYRYSDSLFPINLLEGK